MSLRGNDTVTKLLSRDAEILMWSRRRRRGVAATPRVWRQCVWRLLGQARAFGGRGRRRRGPADRIERPTPPRHRAGVASMACRATDDAATAATDGTG